MILAGEFATADRFNDENTVGSELASATSAATALSTTEAVVDSFTINLVAGRKYRVTANYVYGSVASSTNFFFKLRYKAGATVDTTGTIFHQIAPNGTSGQNQPVTLVGEFAAPTTGQYTIVVGCRMGTGTGSIPSDGTNHAKFACVDMVKL